MATVVESRHCDPADGFVCVCVQISRKMKKEFIVQQLHSFVSKRERDSPLEDVLYLERSS